NTSETTTYTYYLNGNLKTETLPDNTTKTYTYNNRDMLVTEALSTGKTTTYAYNNSGNRTSKTVTQNSQNTVTSYTYDNANRLTQEQTGSSSISYTYDDNGRLISRTSGSVTDTFAYNGYNEMKRAVVGGVTTDYEYNGDGTRRTKTVGNAETVQVWDGENILADLNGSYSLVNSYIRGLRLAEIDDSTATRQYTFNAHGDVTGLVDTTTGAVKDYTYDAYGNEDNASATDTNPFRYSGEYYDAETGFIYLRARYYDPSIGRFTAEDPIRDGTNWYVYCYNNPVKYVDPTGKIPTTEEAALMVQDLYSDYNNDIYAQLIGGWKREDTQQKLGMVMGVYSRALEDGKVEYSLVSKGSLLEFLGDDWLQTYSDWINNIKGPFGSSYDIRAGIKEAQKFVKEHSGNEVTFVGHSKGGAEASANALATNKNAILFNPMSINPLAYGLNSSKYTADMTAYIVQGEILNNIFGNISKPIGNAVYLPAQYDSSVGNHSMSAIIKYLLKQ
ncbi:MAG: RHS repeat-associated core domain-containing protein, partial [Oscillospiraceae bacterium]|nr:RHS repeat-associated core domain-containing protein [Oscillospiraceae bacterium]